jgi:O-antigen/teichoic acid export membrane protein
MGLRLFGTLGATLEIVLLREVIRLDETRGRIAAEKRIAKNVLLVLMVALPVALGLWMVLPAFDRLIVPPSFRGRFASYMAVLLPGFAALTVFQAALYPVFLVGKRTAIATLAALLGLAVNVALAFGLAASLGPMAYAAGQAAAFLVVLIVMGVAALRALPVAPPWRDCALVVLAALVMAAVIWPLRDRFAAPLELTLQIAIGAVVYGAVLLGCDVARCRTTLRLWWLARSSRRR